MKTHIYISYIYENFIFSIEKFGEAAKSFQKPYNQD